MSYQIVDSSPESKQIAEHGYERKNKSSYPFDELNVGMSFTVPLDESKIPSIRSIAHRKSKGDKKFILVRHKELNPPLLEVARVA